MRFNCVLRQIRLKKSWFVIIAIWIAALATDAGAAMSVKAVTPKANAVNIPANSNITVEFDTSVSSATVSANTFTVNGSVSGFKKGTFSVSGAKVTFDSEKDFAIGETITIILTTGIKSTSGSVLAAQAASQFVVAATTGIAYFVDSGQTLGDFASSSVVLGDIDKDGDLDAFVTNAGANKIWKNNGGIFQEGQSMGNSKSWNAAFGDFDKDGDGDLFIVNSDGPDKIWMNDGKGNFTEKQSLGTAHLAFGAVALADLNGDGHLDAFVVGMMGNTVWLNNGTGKLEEGQNLTGPGGLYVALGDLDGDSDLDAFIAIDGNNEVWLNNGKGIFTIGQSMKDDTSAGVALGDLDGDGDLDAFVVNENAPDRVWKNNGKGIFEKVQTLEYPNEYSQSQCISLGDLDGDGDLDAFVANKGLFENEGQPNKVWLNDGTGKFYNGQTFTETDKSWGVALGDLDGDGDLDAFIANLGDPNTVWLNQVLPGDIDGSGAVDLKDAILGLRILVAKADTKGIFLNDVNKDNKISMEDVIFVLQKIAVLR